MLGRQTSATNDRLAAEDFRVDGDALEEFGFGHWIGSGKRYRVIGELLLQEPKPASAGFCTLGPGFSRGEAIRAYFFSPSALADDFRSQFAASRSVHSLWVRAICGF
jgi:hypothetical protein